jgi:5-(carboxyamino)imidazole ribonucleotide synthase
VKIGVLGGGQLAKMLALAGYPMGIEVVCIDPTPDCCAKQVTSVIHANFNDYAAIHKHFKDVLCVTYETENIPIDATLPIANDYKLLPTIDALKITQDRLYEKKFLAELTIPTVQYRQIDQPDDLRCSINELGFPLLLKTRRNGYDGKGQLVIKNDIDAKMAWEEASVKDLIIEAMVQFEFELSLLFARDSLGNMAFYPLTLNHHQHGILRVSEAPFLNHELKETAEQYAKLIAEKLNYVGVMAIEFFCVNGQLIVNELAPRVHNSGHWTIEGAVTSQFENHLRAIAGLPLGSAEARGFSTMINNIGNEPTNLKRLLTIPDLHFHTYGKSTRPNRKLGHITICAKNKHQLDERLRTSLSIIESE